MRIIRIATFVISLSTLIICQAGCSNKFLEPTDIGRFRPVPAVNVILDTLGVAEETSAEWEGAEEPKPIDIMVYETDYVFSPGDVVRISIFELLQEGNLVANEYIITETGKISIPEVGVVEAAGLTESQLEEKITEILSPGILKEPSVSVILLESQERTFSVLGEGVTNPNRYRIPRYDFRLTDAIAIAGGIRQFNVSTIYVSRALTGSESISEPGVSQPAGIITPTIPEKEMLEIIAPRAQRRIPSEALIITSSEMATDEELIAAALPEGFESLLDDEPNAVEQRSNAVNWEFQNGKWVPVARVQPSEPVGQIESIEKPEPSGRETIEEPIDVVKSGNIEWVFKDGKWIPVQIQGPEPSVPPLEEPGTRTAEEQGVPEEFDWSQIGTGGVQRRVIKISADKLTGGDPRYNIVVRPGDSIQVPFDIVGEFYVFGNTNNVGVVTLTGRPMTLKMAMSAAGGLGPLAWPKRCEIVRRIGKNKEETVMVDLDKIASGEQPDFFIKPDDWINIGTHPTARWRAVLRNAFRATYGFGFIYDRNFADRDYGTSRPFPDWSW